MNISFQCSKEAPYLDNQTIHNQTVSLTQETLPTFTCPSQLSQEADKNICITNLNDVDDEKVKVVTEVTDDQDVKNIIFANKIVVTKSYFGCGKLLGTYEAELVIQFDGNCQIINVQIHVNTMKIILLWS